MNTEISISVVKSDQQSTVEINDAIEDGFSQFDNVVKKYTRFNQDSELSNLNRNSGKWAQVSPELFRLVRLMVSLSEKSNGAFDPTVIDFLETYGYDPNYDFSKLENPDLDKSVQEITEKRSHWSEIEFDEQNMRIKLSQNQRVDLGGVGKGYAVDLAADVLKDLNNFMISAGGDILVRGKNEKGNDWQIALKHKNNQGEEILVGEISATDIALTSSGSWARKVKQFHHIIDPTTGKPTDGLATVFVTGTTATMADGWSTALFVGGHPLIESLPEGYSALLISGIDKAIKSDNFPLFITG